MPLYGLYIRDLAAGDLVWFTTVEALQPGTYTLARTHTGTPDVHLAESIPALVLQVGRIIDLAEDLAQESFGAPGTSEDVERRIETDMTDGLLQRLTETGSIWVRDPPWVDDLRPVPAGGG